MYNDDLDEYADEEDKEEDDVRCARCRKWIPAFSKRCPQCGVHFQGQAQDFDEEEEYQQRGLPLWVILTAIVLLALMVLGIFEFGLW